LSKDDPRVVQYLLSVGFDPNARGYEGSTPLHHAARAGYPRKVAALLEAGAKIDVLDEVGSPLQTGWSVAPRVTDKDVLDLLKNYDADYPGKFEKQEEEKTPV
jgi:ankyrin repeat protein